MAQRSGRLFSLLAFMRNRKTFIRSLFFFFLLTCLLTGLAGTVRVPVQAAPNFIYPASSIVISEFRFRGDGLGNDEFVELYNPTSASIDISGWLIRGSNSLGATSTRATIPAATVLIPGQYYLVAHTGYSGPTLPDLTYGTGITDDGGVALTLADTTTIIDQVGLSTGSAYKEGTPEAPLTANLDQGYERYIGGANGNCQDDGNNVADFTLVNPSNPQNSSSGTVVCGVPTATTPPAIDVIINEVAWAGTQAFSGDEWIELFNAGTLSADLTNWRLEAADGDPVISLTGYTIPANGYLLLERGSPNVTTVSTGGNIVTATYLGGLLNNSGETLYLLDDSSQIVSTANANGGAWPGGSGSPNFPSMERSGNVPDSDFVWITFANTTFIAQDAGGNNIYGTPGAYNWGYTVVPTFTPTITLTPTNTLTPSPTNTLTPSPTATPAGFLSVVINEVAWMGTGASTADEWIELYNPGSIAISLAGWVLKADDTSPNITFPAGASIPAGGFFLLERTDDNTVIDVTANLTYTGELNNSYEVLRLYDSANRLIDTANSNGGLWPAGSTTTLGSMERRAVVVDSDTAWITNASPASWLKHDARGTSSTDYLIRGTPGYANWALSVTATPSPSPTATRTPFVFRTSTPLLPPPPPLVGINEFVPRPGSDWNNDGFINTSDEYIELINHGVVPVNLSGYRLDDEVNVGSNPFSLPSVTLEPGERIVFYGSQTGLLLSDGGDGVRLIKPNGQLGDAYNYSVVQFPDQSFCRLPDNGGLDDWNTNCYPTPGLRNSLSGSILRPPTLEDEDQLLCPIADSIPYEFFLAECTPFGNNIWNRQYWDIFGWYGGKALPFMNGKWEVYAE